ncbi:MAG: DUF3999 family protein [Rudaea sp.]|nr:DUF3999 family protein [Rudaea sp.]
MNVRHTVAFSLFILCLNARAALPDEYAYAWPLQTPGDSAAWQVELTPEIYAAISSADLRDVEVVNAAGEPVPFAPYRVFVNAATQELPLVLPVFELPEPPANAPAMSADEAIRLHIERGADGRLRRLDAKVGDSAPPASPRTGVGGARAPMPISGRGAGSASTADVMPAAGSQRDLLLDASRITDPLSGLRIDWEDNGADISAQFALSASDDLQTWRSLLASATVLRLNQDGNRLDRHEIALPGIRAAYLRLRRLDAGPALPSLRILARRSLPSTGEQPARQHLTATLVGSDVQHMDRTLPAGDGQRVVAYRYQLPAALAIEAVNIELADDNSLARVHVLSRQGMDNPMQWLQRADLVAFRLREDDTVIGNDEVAASGAGRAQDWRIEFTTPLAHAPTLSVAYLPQRFVFLSQGAGPYRLLAGSARARRGDYPIEGALAQLRGKLGASWQPPLATPGPRTMLQGDRAFEAPPPAPVQRDWKTWLLWAVLAAAAALIGALALSLLRKPDSR